MARTPYLGVGINKYAGRGNSLTVCVADANMFATLFGAKPTLLDKKGTRSNILRAIPDFCAQSHEPGTGMWSVAHYSGHGSQEPSNSENELDGMDELIVTVELDGVYDKEFAGLIKDRHLDKRQLWVFDSCFSAGMYRAVSLGLEHPEVPRGRSRYLAPAKLVLGQGKPPLQDVQPNPTDGPALDGVVIFAGCANFEYSWEASKNGVWTDALMRTYDPTLTIKGWFARAVRAVASGPFGKRQHPQLICSREAMEWGVPTR